MEPLPGEVQEWQYTGITDPNAHRTWTTTTSLVNADGSYDVRIGPYDTYSYSAIDGLHYESLPTVEGSCTHRPDYLAIAYPVRVGTAWNYEGARECVEMIFDEVVTRRTIASEVTAFEHVTTDAGTFYAARVESHEQWVHTDADWPDLNESGTAERVCWWATEIGRMVRCDVTYRSSPDDDQPNEWEDEHIEELSSLAR